MSFDKSKGIKEILCLFSLFVPHVTAFAAPHGLSKAYISAASVENASPDFSYIDSMAIKAPPDIGQDPMAVARYLLKLCKNDMDKARAAF